MICMKSARGQSLIETLLMLPILMLTLTALSFICYRTVIYFYADFYLHEALLCANERSEKKCSLQLEKQLSKILFTKKSSQKSLQINIKKTSASINGHIEIHFSQLPFKFNMPIVLEKKVLLQLKTQI